MTSKLMIRKIVIPVKTGIQGLSVKSLDSGFRRNDEFFEFINLIQTVFEL